jgi:hypothetical protein
MSEEAQLKDLNSPFNYPNQWSENINLQKMKEDVGIKPVI